MNVRAMAAGAAATSRRRPFSTLLSKDMVVTLLKADHTTVLCEVGRVPLGTTLTQKRKLNASQGCLPVEQWEYLYYFCSKQSQTVSFMCIIHAVRALHSLLMRSALYEIPEAFKMRYSHKLGYVWSIYPLLHGFPLMDAQML